MSRRVAAEQALSGRPPSVEEAEAFQRWVNQELRTLLEQLRRAANALNPEPISPTVTTDGAGTYAVLWTSGTMPQDAIWEIHAHVVGDSATVRASYEMAGVFESVAGVCAQSLPTVYHHSYESAAGCDARFVVDTTNRVVTVEARDDAVVAMSWTGTVYTPAEAVVE